MIAFFCEIDACKAIPNLEFSPVFSINLMNGALSLLNGGMVYKNLKFKYLCDIVPF